MKHMIGWTFALALATSAAAAPVVSLNEAEYRDKVFGCWMGKNIGGTLGMPFESNTELRDLAFYANVKAGEPAANDDLDQQLLWLKAMQDRDGAVDARVLGEHWLKYVPVDWNEYGIGKANMRRGLLPPLSGEYDNKQWKNSNGAWIRSEIWACLFPGQPALAARFAREDACVDHGQAEGTYAEIFMAVIESAAFVEPDRGRLIALGLSMIPEECRVARAVNTVLKAKADGKDWKAAREAVVKETADLGWFQAPGNVAFTMLGWVYGDNDFGKSLCIAVGCGDDTDCTGATLGSLLGIIGGYKSIPQKWIDPIGLKIKTVAISGFDNPGDLNALTDQTVAMSRRLQAKWGLPVTLTKGPTDLSQVAKLDIGNTKEAKKLLALSPYRIVWNDRSVVAVLDYLRSPDVTPGEKRELELELTNPTEQTRTYDLDLGGVPAGWQAEGLPAFVTLKGGKTEKLRFRVSVAASDGLGWDYRMTLHISGGYETVNFPLTLVGKAVVGPNCLSLASKGATATSDSELDREPGCTPKVIDGIICSAEDYQNRWHASISKPMPHWIEVKLAKPARVNRVILRFADPKGYATQFDILAKVGDTYQRVGGSEANQEPRSFRATFDPVTTDTVKLVIRASANPQYPTAAQLSEFEVYGAD